LEKRNSTEYPKNRVSVNFTNSIFENVAAGCTMVVSRDHLMRLIEFGCCEIDGSYDHIIHLMSMALNEVYFDQEAKIFYRIHGNNAVGITQLGNRSLTKTRQDICRKKALLEKVSRNLRTEMNETDSNFAMEVLRNRNFRNRAKWVFFLPKLRQDFRHDCFLKLFLLCI
jgi:hypothetical protein